MSLIINGVEKRIDLNRFGFNASKEVEKKVNHIIHKDLVSEVKKFFKDNFTLKEKYWKANLTILITKNQSKLFQEMVIDLVTLSTPFTTNIKSSIVLID